MFSKIKNPKGPLFLWVISIDVTVLGIKTEKSLKYRIHKHLVPLAVRAMKLLHKMRPLENPTVHS